MPSILFLKSDYVRSGGPETLLRSLAETIDRRRFDPVLAIIRRPGQPPLSSYPDSLRQVEIAWRGAGALLSAARQIAALARQTNAALVHTHDMRADAIGAMVRGYYGIPWIAHVHGWLGHTHRGRWRLYEAIDRRLIRGADLVLVGSDAARQEVHAAGVRRVEVVPNAVVAPDARMLDAECNDVRNEIGAPDRSILLGVVGRLHPGKGQEIFLRALAALVASGVHVHGLIVGEGPDAQRLRAVASELGVANRVTFTGFVDDATRYLRASDIVVVPSFKDSLPLTALEAMAFARPVVATRTGDLPVAIEDGVSGFIIPVGDTAALAARLGVLAVDPALRRGIGAAGRRRAISHYGAAAMACRLQAQYDAVIARKRGDAT